MSGKIFRIAKRSCKDGGDEPSIVDMVCSSIRDGRWHSYKELAISFSLPLEFVEEICLFLQRYGFADLRGEWVRLDPDQPTLHETARFLRSLARRSIAVPVLAQFYITPCSYCLSFGA
jgi:hypothetical protein